MFTSSRDLKGHPYFEVASSYIKIYSDGIFPAFKFCGSQWMLSKGILGAKFPSL
jgi:hypothetical protein